MKNENKSFEKQWRRHGFLTTVMTTGIAGGCLFLLLACIDFFAPLQNLLLPAASAMIAAYVAAYGFLMVWKCPCCGQNFYGWTRDTSPGFSAGCQNCGLRRSEGAGNR